MIKINLNKFELKNGDCLEQMKLLPENSVDSIVTDPPYGISFMGKKWDYDVPSKEIFAEMLRVLKPGGHALIACGTRTQHRMVTNVEDAGFEIRDVITHLYGSGFPKSQDIVKSGQKQGIFCECEKRQDNQVRSLQQGKIYADGMVEAYKESDLQPSMQRSVEGQGMGATWPQGSASKEEIHGNVRPKKSGVEGRSHLQKEQGELHRAEIRPMPQRVSSDGEKGRLCNGTPSSNGEAFESNSIQNGSCSSQGSQHSQQSHIKSGIISRQQSPQTCGSCGKAIGLNGWGTALKPACEFWTLARKPLSEKTVASNVLKHGTGGINIDGCRIETDSRPLRENSGKQDPRGEGFGGKFGSKAIGETNQGRWPANLILDEEAAEIMGEPSRFFYVAKASKSERNQGCSDLPDSEKGENLGQLGGLTGSGNPRNYITKNNHPTVKPIKLMTYLCRLITPPNGIVLDPFMGSGSTGVAAVKEGFGFIGIEREPQYYEICKARIEAAS